MKFVHTRRLNTGSRPVDKQLFGKTDIQKSKENEKEKDLSSTTSNSSRKETDKPKKQKSGPCIVCNEKTSEKCFICSCYIHCDNTCAEVRPLDINEPDCGCRHLCYDCNAEENVRLKTFVLTFYS